MDKLPPEIIDLIAQKVISNGFETHAKHKTRPPLILKVAANVRRLRTTVTGRGNPVYHQPSRPKHPLASLATVSRQWQHAVERKTFAEITCTSSELQDFIALFSRCPHRRQHLRAVSYTVLMPIGPAEDLPTPEECKGKYDARAIVARTLLQPLFQVLSSWSNANTIDMRLAIGTENVLDRRRGSIHPGSSICPVSVAAVCELPLLPFVCRLSFHPIRSTWYVFSPQAQLQIASRMHNLGHLDLYLEDGPSPPVNFLQRQTLAEDLSGFLDSQSIRKLSLSISVLPCAFSLGKHDCWVDGEHDPFFATFRQATADVTELCYSGWIDGSFFWPYHHHHDHNSSILVKEVLHPPTWRSLRHLTVCMSLVTPTGKWYFKYREDEDVETHQQSDYSHNVNTPAYWPPSEENRVSGASRPMNNPRDSIDPGRGELLEGRHPRDETMNPLLLSFARLLSSNSVPALQTAQIVARRKMQLQPWVVCYCAPGLTSRHVLFDKRDIARPRVWLVTEQWKPSTQVVDLFRKAGSAVHGQEAAVVWWRNPRTPFAGFSMR